MKPLAAMLDVQRGHLANWIPVCLALGIAGYFSLKIEPNEEQVVWALVTAVCLYVSALRIGPRFAPLFLAVALVLTGFLCATIRANTVAAPVLGFRYYGPVEGRIEQIDRSQTNAVRLTLSEVRLRNIGPDETPRYVRVSLHGQQGWIEPEPGLVVAMTAHLSPPNGPVEPGGFDFQRMAWFKSLGAVGYTRTPVLPVERPPDGVTLARIRHSMSEAIRREIPGQSGAFAAAILTGDRAHLPVETVEALRVSNLAHLLAISGLHMGLLTGVVFAAMRFGLAVFQVLSAKKVAAVVALVVGAFYLGLSGASVATERAYIMVAVMFIAVLLDRRAVTLRAVAFAATLVLLRRPEDLSGPGFQMSFAATTALVLVFGAMRERMRTVPKWARPVAALVVSSLVAGLATAPFAAAHFNRLAHYGLIANLAAVPVMGSVVMPAAVASGLLWLIGLQGAALWALDLGIEWILRVAETVSGWSGAASWVVSAPPLAFALLSFGAVWLAAVQGPARWVSLVLLGSALLLWLGTERPAVLISDRGSLIGVMMDEGRALSKAKGDGFAAVSWLENDGDSATQAVAAERTIFTRDGDMPIAEVAGQRIGVMTGQKRVQSLSSCPVDILVTNARDVPDLDCLVLGAEVLAVTGAVAISSEGAMVTARDVTGERLWNGGATPLRGMAHILNQ